MDNVNINGLDRADVLRVLYNAAKPHGLGVLEHDSAEMTREEAEGLLSHRDSFDYVHDRIVKVSLAKGAGSFNPRRYDRDNGQGAAERAVSPLRQGTDRALVAIVAGLGSSSLIFTVWRVLGHAFGF